MMHTELVAGDTLSFLTTVADYKASAGWTLTFRLVPRTAANAAISLVAVPAADDYRTAVTAAVTAAWTPDTYSWTSWVSLAGEVYSIESGQIVVRANPRTVAAGYDGRTQAQKAFDDCKVAVAAWSPTTRRYRIGDREREFTSKADAVGLMHYWQAEVAKEQRGEALAKGLPDPRKSYVRINRE